MHKHHKRMSNEYVHVWTYNVDDAILLAVSNYVADLVRGYEGLANIEEITISRVDQANFQLRPKNVLDYSELVIFTIREPEDDNAECVLKAEGGAGIR